ncbi:hypothetical protein NDU88_005614 [Pleurodeles waltl]|uniref:Uncharacterized protein n=1 Tax=Pleurodeles waltl TaxID=8319 RepID=A0AAV7NQW5_PLEWA|nr:hypothetical protein NDU88_005614 [Pleurodeles waltl]
MSTIRQPLHSHSDFASGLPDGTRGGRPAPRHSTRQANPCQLYREPLPTPAPALRVLRTQSSVWAPVKTSTPAQGTPSSSRPLSNHRRPGRDPPGSVHLLLLSSGWPPRLTSHSQAAQCMPGDPDLPSNSEMSLPTRRTPATLLWHLRPSTHQQQATTSSRDPPGHQAGPTSSPRQSAAGSSSAPLALAPPPGRRGAETTRTTE